MNKIGFENNTTLLETFIASRLMPLEKNLGLRPIGVGEVLHRIAGKVVMSIVKDDVAKAVAAICSCVVGKMQDVRSQYIRCMAYLQQTRQKKFYLLMLKTRSIP